MTLGENELEELAEVAARAARAAGDVISSQRATKIEKKSGMRGASQWVTDVDRRAEEIILAILAPTLEQFALGLLTEEREDDCSRFDSEFFWCVDPLDGTLPFLEGVGGYAVSIALVSRQGEARLGAVYDPTSGDLYQARAGGRLTCNGELWQQPAQGPKLSVFVDRSFLARTDYAAIAEKLEGIAQKLGLGPLAICSGAGAVMNACQVLREPRACYLKLPKAAAGGGSVWDFAATACIVKAAGAIATDMHGDELELNRADSTFMNHGGVLFATDEELAKCLRGLL
tara:strand:- start:25832 stop:26689 length:858 start_codon:yes stop_codon:yes gene_type:complete